MWSKVRIEGLKIGGNPLNKSDDVCLIDLGKKKTSFNDKIRWKYVAEKVKDGQNG